MRGNSLWKLITAKLDLLIKMIVDSDICPNLNYIEIDEFIIIQNNIYYHSK